MIKLIFCFAILFGNVFADNKNEYGIIVKNAKITAKIKGKNKTNAAAYLDIENNGEYDESVIGASCPICEKIELHKSYNENGIHKMRKINNIKIEKGKTISLKPSSLHLMLIGIKNDIHENDNIKITIAMTKSSIIANCIGTSNMKKCCKSS